MRYTRPIDAKGAGMDPEAVRRRGIAKVALGVGILVVMVVMLFVAAPLYNR